MSKYKLEPVCPKCGAIEEVKLRYIDGMEYHVKEYVACKCNRCEYSWHASPLNDGLDFQFSCLEKIDNISSGVAACSERPVKYPSVEEHRLADIRDIISDWLSWLRRQK